MKKPRFAKNLFKHKSLMFQLFTQLLSIMLFMLALLLFLNSRYIQMIFYTRTEAIQKNAVSTISKLDMSSDSFFDELKKIEDKNTAYVEIFNSESNTLVYSTVLNEVRNHTVFDFEKDGYLIFPYASAKKISVSNVIEQTDDGVYFIGHDIMSDIDYMVYQSYLDNGNKVNIYVQKNVIDSNATYTSDIIRAVICIIGALLMIAFFIYAWLFTRPLIEMNDVTRRMAKMDFSKKCITKSTTELGELADNINSMSDSLADTLGDLKEKNRQLEIDIEHEHKMVKSRKEFVSNVSHELKTPIAIIQGYAEGLKLGISDDPETQMEYLDVIIEESQRMNNLVLDLLELSYYESGMYKLSEDTFSINNMINEYVSSQKIRLKEKEITVDLLVQENIYGWGDESKISMVLNNYFSNAVSHCEEEKKIIITSEEIDSNYRISVFNTGKNIEEEHLDEMWSDFYRGDKSHRREEGRFGIGLSIVKSIQNMHNMAFGCQNKPDGVEFWFDIKKAVNTFSN